jgi:DNA polymerase III epsilon subunit-like protein
MHVPIRERTFAFVDCETTGIDPAVDRVVDFACVVVRGGKRIASYESLVNPGRPIPAVASAIHHIRDRDVASAPRLHEVVARARPMIADAIVVAHNASFDRAFLPFVEARPVACSLRLAMHVLDDVPNYKNQVLRYALDIDDAALEGLLPHRALADAIVTSHIFTRCLDRYVELGLPQDLDGFLKTLEAPSEMRKIWHRRDDGKAFGRIPADFLEWICGGTRFAERPDVVRIAARELRRRREAMLKRAS